MAIDYGFNGVQVKKVGSLISLLRRLSDILNHTHNCSHTLSVAWPTWEHRILSLGISSVEENEQYTPVKVGGAHHKEGVGRVHKEPGGVI